MLLKSGGQSEISTNSWSDVSSASRPQGLSTMTATSTNPLTESGYNTQYSSYFSGATSMLQSAIMTTIYARRVPETTISTSPTTETQQLRQRQDHELNTADLNGFTFASVMSEKI